MSAFIRKDKLEVAAKLGVMDCFSCGSCSYVCPSHIPLVHYFNYAKGVLNDLERERQKNERIKTLAEVRTIRIEKVTEAKRAALAARKPAADSAAPGGAGEAQATTQEKADA
jgi:electron transport complex protein RnfC